ncbi:proline-rich receptor-like protein kinase PERK2 [Iris pallida]|uniref:Proline-rich receptor-like protein kinase PERK2 n=1 Tax=Iris pallida TaxID=29817 RepID=A0AAX6F596_IRIPA|nr:proline-rich receptor-like protein kinase PERK2 [Iris pallida]KAJ6837678.1 proline-rich receptor-like protein kinase PERK2 [Iris pallida]
MAAAVLSRHRSDDRRGPVRCDPSALTGERVSVYRPGGGPCLLLPLPAPPSRSTSAARRRYTTTSSARASMETPSIFFISRRCRASPASSS